MRPMTKKEAFYYNAYNNSAIDDIHDCYKKPSNNKVAIQAICKQKMYKQMGERFRIITYNQCFFTCGWKTPDDVLHIETPTKSIEIDVSYLPF